VALLETPERYDENEIPIDRRRAWCVPLSLALVVHLGGCVDMSEPAGPRTSDGASSAVDAGRGDAARTCPEGFHACGGACIDTRADFSNCGGCGIQCAVGAICTGSACIVGECPSGTAECGGSCIDTMTDRRHCGACDQPCPGTDACIDGVCAGCGTGISFAADVQPIFTASCLGMACHADRTSPSGELILEAGSAWAALVGVQSSCSDGRLLVAPGAPDASYLVHKITDDQICSGGRMPLSGRGLSAAEIATIEGWICGGARTD
jgi:hypothetical protein